MKRKKKIGRNEPCPCNSGRKYKKCCGNPLKKDSNYSKSQDQQFSQVMHDAIERQKANELIRQQQQGHGKPIISAKYKGRQLVAVGNRIYHSPKWKTFEDFLSDYIKTTLGEEWGNDEIAKPLAERHPIMQWYDKLCRFQNSNTSDADEIKSADAIGVVYCYLGLAYNLYLLKHNVELQERFINRLKNRGNFQGAYYELIVAGCLITAGLELTLEDETDKSSKHCEFAAISKKTGKKYWVEAKMRSVSGYMCKTNIDGTKDSNPTGMLSKHLNKALKKPAADERFIFIDLNATPDTEGSKPSWVEIAANKLDMREKDLEPGQNAYVFVTNMSFHRALDSVIQGRSIMAFGLGIPDFSKPGHYRLSEIYRKKQKHIDAHNLVEAFSKYPQIPTTFDGTLPSETYSDNSQRIIIGETYFFDDVKEVGVLGKVTSATVDKVNKKAYYAITTEDGDNLILNGPISDDELIDYKNHPEAFFGIVHSPSRKVNDPYELFEFFLHAHSNTPKERLLELMKNAPDIDSLRKMKQSDLAIEYCERLASSKLKGNETTPD